jgi:alpha-glucosidase
MTDTWWQRGVIYQIYPRSFQDADGDGIGDLDGIMRRLEYCAWLGADVLWLSPIYPSPMADFGYDVSDYTEVHPMFGTLAKFDELVAQIKRRDMKLILDYVPNHTSDEHPWFKESRSSRRSSKRDWYLWRDPGADGGPPNNWLSNFGGSAWEWDAHSGQYYYHAFLREQPDLNWRHPGVVSAMHDVLRFWLNRGVDGFRVDVLWFLIKDDQWRDNPPNPDYTPGGMPRFHSQIPVYTADRPEVQNVVAGLRRVVDEFDGKVLIGEIYLPLDRLMAYYGTDLDGVHLPFNFQLLRCTWNAPRLAALIDQYEAALPHGGWPNWVLGNHDSPRIASRVGLSQARVAAMLLLSLRGTPTLYYGDELGMVDVPICAERVRDPLEQNVPGAGLGRDPSRTPMQWDGSLQGGFTEADPWLPISGDCAVVNVQSEGHDPASMLSLYRSLLLLRRSCPALSVGEYEPVAATRDLLAYVRRAQGECILVALNLGSEPHSLSIDSLGSTGQILLSTYTDRSRERVATSIGLRPDEGVIMSLSELEDSPAS